MHQYFDECDDFIMDKLKKTIQDSLTEMVDGSSNLIRLLFFITNKSEGTKKQYETMKSNGTLNLWISTFHNLVQKIENHFTDLISLLFSYMKSGSDLDIKNVLEKINNDLQKAIDEICPIESQLEKQKFFISQICEKNGSIFFSDGESAHEGMEEQGVISTNKRPDGRGIHIVSKSIANIQSQNFLELQNPFEFICYETGIINGNFFYLIDI